MGEKREYPGFIVNNGPEPVTFNFKFHPGKINLDDNITGEEDNFMSPDEYGKEETERILTALPLDGTVEAYS